MRGTFKVALVAVLVVALGGCGGPIDDGGDDGLQPESSTAELKNNGGGGTGPSCSASGNPSCSITCNGNEIAVCSDAICIFVFPGVCVPTGPASCSCKTRSVIQFSASRTAAQGAAVDAAR
jgi:hypothetical protein